MARSSRFPLGGDVVQSINPWDFWTKFVSSQLGFINVKNVMSGDHQIEQEIIEDVASYGRQLGQIADVLEVLIKYQDREDLQPGEEEIVRRFQKMATEINRIRKKWKTPEKLLADLDTVLSQIRELKPDSPDAYEMAIARIKNELQTLESENNIGVTLVSAKKPSPKSASAENQSMGAAKSDLPKSPVKAAIVASPKKTK